MQNYYALKNFALYLLLVSLFTSCEKEELIIEHKKVEGNDLEHLNMFTRQLYSSDKLSKEISLTTKLKEISKKSFTSGTRSVHSESLGFTILTNYAQYISSDDGKFYSFTFPVIRQDVTEILENAVFSFENDEFKSALLLSYKFSPGDLENIRKNIAIDATQDVTILNIDEETVLDLLDTRDYSCSYEVDQVCVENACTVDGCWDSEWTTWSCNNVMVYVCNDTENGNTTSGHLSDGPAPQPNYGNLGGTSGGGSKETITAPVDPDILSWNFFMLNMPQDLRDLLVMDSTINNVVFDYLVAERFSAQARAIIEDAFEIYEGQDGDNPTYKKILNDLTNCTKANELLTDTQFRQSLSNIQSRAHNDSESGYEISKAPEATQSTTNFVEGGFDRLKLNVGGNIIGGIHHHTNIGYPMYSAEDVVTLFFTYIKNDHRRDETIQASDVFSGLVVPVGTQSTNTYLLKINNILALGRLINAVPFKSFKDQLDRAYNVEMNRSFPNYKKVLLKTIERLSLKYNIHTSPIALYDFNEAIGQFEKVSLHPTENSTQNTPCN
ncbi:hypothetical protein [Dokdonia sp. Hel_I_53]|uniref:hypothetical protein n=1 Tax=Dokdonia sp. Hel_I_53 TaxID=1566287 RepID=UPI00119B8603|nr:hypothetical protein [Dokdonia sp. Hel_I_53]TVZ52753.1 hypothetical protein OD90_1937 [Dokdonia sp. Hel_I_53]